MKQPAQKTVGRFEILQRIGRGGMATVYLARQLGLDRLVALKELGAFDAEEPSLARRFLRESRLAGALAHPNIVTVFDYFEHDGTPYIAMEYLERGSLRPHVGRMPLAQTGAVISDILAGLGEAERQGVVHRDLKPENVLVDRAGSAKIADFGIAKATSSVSSGDFVTETGLTVGTPAYMAPEQAMGREVGPWTDLYALGCMAYETVVGRLPYVHEAPMALLMQKLHEAHVPACEANPAVPPRLSDWIEWLLAKDSERRCAVAGDAADALDELLHDLLGSRWRRGASLPEVPAAVSLTPVPGPYTPPPAGPPEVVPAETGGYETYVEPAPPRPPIDTSDEPLPVRAGPAPKPESPADPARVHESQPATAAGSVLAATLAPEPRVRRREEPDATARRSRSLPRMLFAGVALVAVVAVVAVIAAGRKTDPTPTPAKAAAADPTVLATTGLQLEAPAGFRAVKAPAIRGLDRDATRAVSDGEDLVLLSSIRGRVSPRTLLPAGLEGELKGKVQNSRARIGSLDAFRYDRLRLSGVEDELTLLVAPTTAGVASVACTLPADACAALASSVRTEDVSGYPLGPSRALASRTNRAVAAIEAARSRRVDRPSAWARRVADAAGSSASLASLEVGPGADDLKAGVVQALRRLGSAFHDIGREASDAERRRITQALAAWRRAVSALRRAGYADVRLPARERLPSLRVRTRKPASIAADPVGAAPADPETSDSAATAPRSSTPSASGPVVPQPTPQPQTPQSEPSTEPFRGIEG